MCKNRNMTIARSHPTSHTLSDLELCLQEEDVKIKDMQESTPRRNLRQQRELRLAFFLRTYGFRDVDRMQQGGCFSFKERLCPLHIAAAQGDSEMVRILLAAGADASQKTSKGRTALEIAESRSYFAIADLLRGDVKVVSVRQLSKLRAENSESSADDV